MVVTKVNSKIIPKISLRVKNGWRVDLKVFLLNPKGLLDPLWWRNKIWIITKAKIMKGRIKWKVKKRVKVGVSTANPPHNHRTIEFPT